VLEVFEPTVSSGGLWRESKQWLETYWGNNCV
jgi:hypothetical protein